MKTRNNRWLILAGFAFVAITFVAWKNIDNEPDFEYYAPAPDHENDTTPARKRSSHRKEYKLNELDDAMKELDRAMVDLDKGLKVDLARAGKDIKAAMEEIRNIDFDKINAEVRASLKEVDWENTRSEVRRALKEAEKELRSVDKEKIRAEIDAAKAESFVLGDLIKGSVELGLQAAKIGLNAAKKELQLLKEFTDELEKDGLIDKDEKFRIQIKDDELIINGKKQSKEVNDKYRKYFKHRNYTISSDGDDDLEIN